LSTQLRLGLPSGLFPSGFPTNIIYCNVYISKYNFSEIGFCLRLEVKPTQLDPIDIATKYIDWIQLSRFYLKTETESSLRNVATLNKHRTTDNDQKYKICRRVVSSGMQLV
jgi:hypothetical protein